MPERSPEMDLELQRLQEMADQLKTALDALKRQIDASDAAKAAREGGTDPIPPESAGQS